jgi:serine/threonine protein kinase
VYVFASSEDARGTTAMNEASAAEPVAAASNGLIAPGARIGRYEVVHRIACGGMAEIYLARASGIYGFEKYVVLKRILPQYASNVEFVRMFLKEARVAASLDHANIAHVHDIGETGGSTFFTMEYLHGEDLRHVVRHLEHGPERIPLEHALEIVMGAAAGLHFAHEKRGADGRSLGIVHRDVSPANIVVTYDGGVKLVDFGIAKLGADRELSQRYALKGKLAYMSPEQLHNQPVDRRSDVFSLGIVLYEITTGTRLFKGSTEVQTMKSVLDGVVPPPSSVLPGYPPALERIVLRALAQVPADRYQTARELQVDLEAFVHDERLRVSPTALAEWMERTFGPKQEIWHTLPQPSAGPRSAAGQIEPTAATKLVSRSDVSPVPAAAAVGFSLPIEISVPVRPRGGRWVWPLSAMALLALGGGGWWFTRGLHASPAGAGASNQVVLVAEQGNVALERVAPAPALPEAAPTAPPAPATTTPAADKAAPSSAPAPTTPHAKRNADPSGAPHGGSFSGTFARREGEIRRCYLAHADGAASTDISLRFEVDRDGHVSNLAVLPAAVGSSPLGTCLAAVGKSTLFPKQPSPVTFRIPLTVQREPGRTSGP